MESDRRDEANKSYLTNPIADQWISLGKKAKKATTIEVDNVPGRHLCSCFGLSRSALCHGITLSCMKTSKCHTVTSPLAP